MTQALLTQFGDSSSGLGALGVDGKAFVVQLLTFIFAFLVLKRYAFKPIIKVLRERRETIESGVKLGDEMQKERIALEAKVGEELGKARKQADGIVAASQETARDMIREAEAKAHDKADDILAEAKQRTQQDVARARKQLEGELVGLIADATEAIIDEKVDAKKDALLIEKALKEHARA